MGQNPGLTRTSLATSLNFRSDNEAPAHPRILEALARANTGHATAYADDDWSLALDERFSEVFGTACRVLPLATGTAGNSIALAELCPPWGAILCHPGAHIHNDEGGAPEFYSHGAKLVPVPGDQGKLDPRALAGTIDSAGVHGVHNVKPSVVSITQATECGTAYYPDQVQAISRVCRERGLPLHMDGARFANALVHLDCSPAEATWQAGVDVLVFGASKNGCLAAEAIVVFGSTDWIEGMERRRKRGGHLLSKMRYVSAQLLASMDDGLWLELAGHANSMAARLAEGIESAKTGRLEWPVEANEVFARLPEDTIGRLREAGGQFHVWPGSTDLVRLVCSFATTGSEVDRFVDTLDA